jgi:hypothetical protein
MDHWMRPADGMESSPLKGGCKMLGAKKYVLGGAFFLAVSISVLLAASADHDDKQKHRDKEKHGVKEDFSPVSNGTYRTQCGACHFVYQPELLPSRSWEKLLSGLKDHFGEAVEFDLETLKTIREFLTLHAADQSGAERAKKIIRSLGSSTPLRVSEVPYIAEKHHDVTVDVFQRSSIGSRGNCIACHKKADAGIYDDDDVVIPK